VGDKVNLLDTDGVRKGPYLIASLPSPGNCTLSEADGKAVRNGNPINIDDVEAA
jgi:hypothetical protein